MSPVLIDSIRQRMREHTTEQLLEMWVTNDRVTWSPEAFEAVKDILAERGQTELPPQNGPAPVGRTWSPFDRPESEYWMGWLRPVLWMGITVAILALVRAPLTVTACFRPFSCRQARGGHPWRGCRRSSTTYCCLAG